MAKNNIDKEKSKKSQKRSRSKDNGKANKRYTNEKSHSEVSGIILITIGILMLLSLASTIFSNQSSLSGMIGLFVYKLFVGLIGLGAYVMPVFCIFIGASYITKSGNITFTKRFYGIVLFIINSLLFIQMTILSNYYVKDNIMVGVEKIYNSSSIFHGGIIGYFLSVPLYKLFGKLGSYIIFIAVYIISITLIKDITIKDMISEIVNKKDSLRENKLKADEKILVNEDLKENIIEENSISQVDTNHKIKIIDFLKSTEIDDTGKSEKDFIQYNIREEKKEKAPITDKAYTSELEEEIHISNFNSNKNFEYKSPDVDLLYKNEHNQLKKGDKKDLLNSASKLQETLLSFGVEAKVIQVTKGPSVTRFELQPSAGVKVSKIVNLSDDIALNLASSGVRIEAPIPGKAAVGIEVPNRELTPVYLREVIESEEFISSNKNLAFCLGKDIGGHSIVSDLTKMPHMLVAGATGSGKSVCINTLLMSLLYKYSPDEVKLLLIDPKVVELNIYNGIPHLLIPVVTDPKKAASALSWAVNEMTRRYKIFADNNVRNIEGYNEMANKGIVEEKLPWIVIIIDELADLMMVCPNDVEDYIGRLAQMARAAGMHLVIATQRPSVDVITGVIKANIPSRISFAVSSQIDSRTILDSSGAEKLLGKGDMLFYPVGEAKPVRIQGAFVSEEEVERVVTFIKNQVEEHQYEDHIIEEIEEGARPKSDDCDELLNEAIKIVIDTEQASTSLLQRRLKIGYNRAARIIEQMEERGVISGKNGSKPRQVLLSKEEYEQ
ncbi:FtsK/SpoIIIE family DNA translocase [Clostridium sp. UBA6640]|uniref:FtsK/SpoIIIE family DNA translocase n=1 Tax=Clostridium sp. UBA6640 TaxID=1946370 RepID=UPI0025BFD2A5|nr:DNA translocase FtsK [Clostridium sp. UBA6640]